MDPPERLVLRRKKLMLSSHFNLSNEQLTRLREAKLLKKTDHDLIKGEPTNIGRVGRLVDVLPVDGFDFLCELLREQNEWLSDELRTELRAELGQIEVEDYISKESSVLVHREFGASKRLAEGEKSKLTSLVAARTQFAKEVWRRQLERAVATLEETIKINKEKDVQAQFLADRVDVFLKENRQRLRRTEPTTPRQSRQRTKPTDTAGTTPGEQGGEQKPGTPRNNENTLKNEGTGTGSGEETGTGATTGSSKDSGKDVALAALEALGAMVNEVIELTEDCAADREGLRVERARLLHILKLEADDETTPVDSRLKNMLTQAAHDLEMAKDKVRFREERTKDLEHRLHEYWIESEKTIETKDETISRTSEQLKIQQEKARDLQLSCMKLEAELRGARNELKQYKEKTARLERNRRLGYKSDASQQPAAQSRFPAIKEGDRTRSLSAKRRNNSTPPWQTIEN